MGIASLVYHFRGVHPKGLWRTSHGDFGGWNSVGLA